MSDTSASFSVDIEETGGDDAASSLEALKAKILADTAALREMQSAMRALKGGTSINVDAFKQLRDQIDAQKASIAGAQSQFINLGGAFGKTADDANDLGDAGGNAGKGLEQALGPLGRLTGHSLGASRGVMSLISSLGGAGLAGVAALAVIAIAAVVAGLAIATVKIAEYAIGLADAARNQKLVTEGLAASSKSLSGLAGILPSIQSATGLATADITKLAEELDSAGVSAKNMPDALRALATATAGGASAAAIAKLKAELAGGTKSAKQLADEMQKTFGGIIAQKMLSLDAQSAKLKSNFGDLFGGLKIDGLLQGLSKLVGLFDANSASGKAIKAVFESIFQPLIDGAAAAIPYIEIGFLTLVLWALKVRNALRPYSDELKLLAEIFGGVLLAAIALVGASIFIAFLPLIVLVGAIVLGIYLVIKVFRLFWAAISAIGDAFVDAGNAATDFFSPVKDAVLSAISAIGDAFSAIGSGASAVFGYITAPFEQAYAFLSGIVSSFGDVGSSIISGIVNAITGGAAAVISSVVNLGKSALSALKGIFDSHSPSKAFGRIADTAPQGVTQSFEEGESDVEKAGANMGTAALRGGKKGMSGGIAGDAWGGSSSGRPTVHIDKIEVHGVAGADDPSFIAKMANAIEQALIGAGLSPVTS